MRRWFLSYHSPDATLAERLKTAIERRDATSSVFFAPANLRAGGFWSAQLAQELAEANAFILLVGERGFGDWQFPEYAEALDRRVKSPDFPVVLILLEGQTAPGLPFLRQLPWIISPDPASDKDMARLFNAASGSGTRPRELWRYTSPYRGLSAMEEKDSDYFFGRKRETVEVLSVLAEAPNSLPVLLGNSGVGKSSVAQAGVVAALKRQRSSQAAGVPPAWPPAFRGSRQWCFLTLRPGTDPLRALVQLFLQTWQGNTTDPAWKESSEWIDWLLGGKATLRDLLDATERRYAELRQPHPLAFFLYIDQGEQLYVGAEERQQRHFSELLAAALPDPRLRVMMSMRTDFLGSLQNDAPLFNARRQIDIPPLREAELREVVSRPAELLSARFETEGLVDVITRRTAEDSIKDVGALPLLSYTLNDMWQEMMRRGDGTLRLPAQSFELADVLVDRANNFVATHPGDEAALRRMLTRRLATTREDGELTPRRAPRGEFSPEEWRLVTALADYPNRLLVMFTTEAGETYAEVAHEAIFRRWDKLREWVTGEREFLVWRSRLEAARRAWQETPGSSQTGALLKGAVLKEAQGWLSERGEDLLVVDRDFIVQSTERENSAGMSDAARTVFNQQLSVAEMEQYFIAALLRAPRELSATPRSSPHFSHAIQLSMLLLAALFGIAASTQIGRSALSHILSLFGLKLSSGFIPVAIDHQPVGPIRDMVECSVFGPPAAPPGETILIQVFLHLAEQARRARFSASVMDSLATLKGIRSLETAIKRGARVEISLAVNRLHVDEPVQSVVWQGQPVFCQFLVTIPQGTSGQSFFPVVRVSVDASLVGCIKFRVSSDPFAASSQSGPLGDHIRHYEYAFVSYATKDRKEVLKRVQMLEIMKTEFFQDLLSLDPGDRWERKLYEQIDRCDLFLLFWSQAAKDSQWVIQEAEYALKKQQLNPDSEPDIVPVILEQNVLPPLSLAALHFNDRIQYLISLMPEQASRTPTEPSAS
jgi:hypothetical protein